MLSVVAGMVIAGAVATVVVVRRAGVLAVATARFAAGTIAGTQGTGVRLAAPATTVAVATASTAGATAAAVVVAATASAVASAVTHEQAIQPTATGARREEQAHQTGHDQAFHRGNLPPKLFALSVQTPVANDVQRRNYAPTLLSAPVLARADRE